MEQMGTSAKDIMNSAMKKVTLDVAEKLLYRKTTLLTSGHDSFTMHTHTLTANFTS